MEYIRYHSERFWCYFQTSFLDKENTLKKRGQGMTLVWGTEWAASLKEG